MIKTSINIHEYSFVNKNNTKKNLLSIRIINAKLIGFNLSL